MRSLVAAIEEKYGGEDQDHSHEGGSWVIYVPKPKAKPGEAGINPLFAEEYYLTPSLLHYITEIKFENNFSFANSAYADQH